MIWQVQWIYGLFHSQSDWITRFDAGILSAHFICGLFALSLCTSFVAASWPQKLLFTNMGKVTQCILAKHGTLSSFSQWLHSEKLRRNKGNSLQAWARFSCGLSHSHTQSVGVWLRYRDPDKLTEKWTDTTRSIFSIIWATQAIINVPMRMLIVPWWKQTISTTLFFFSTKWSPRI